MEPLSSGHLDRLSSKRLKSGSKRKPITHHFTAFSDQLEKALDSATEEEVSFYQDRGIGELLDEVHELGEKLKKSPYFTTLKNYKQAVRGFMKFVIKSSLLAEQHNGARVPGKPQKRHTLIKIIDAKLEQLASGILGNQREQLDILAKVEEINGLLIDLFN